MMPEDGFGGGGAAQAPGIESLWRAFRAPLERRFARLGARGAEVDDLVQETFLRVHAGLGGLNEPRRHAAWIRSIAHNVWMDSLRARREASSEDLAPVAELDEGDDFAQQVGRWLLSTLTGLEETTREIVRRFELEGQEQREIASALGLSVSAVKARLRRGRETIRRRIEGCCSFELDRLGRPVSARRRGAASARAQGLGKSCGDGDRTDCDGGGDGGCPPSAP